MMMNVYFRPRSLFAEPRYFCGGSAPEAQDPGISSMQASAMDLALYQKRAKTDAAAQMGTGQFAGLGTADQNFKVSDQMAQVLLDIQKNYGADYIKQRIADLKQSDPTGYAARKELFDRIIKDAETQPDRPMAQDVQDQVLSMLGQGSKLSTGPGGELEAVQQSVRGKQLANGIFLGNAATSAEAGAVVNAGDALQQQRQTQAQGFLNSGVSPEDVEYRRVQQGLANLGAAISGQTPEAQFASLTGAQRLAAQDTLPNVQSPQLDPNAGVRGMQQSAQIYSGNVNWSNQQVNPWTVGLSGLSGALGTAQSGGLFKASTWSGIGGSGGVPSGSTPNYGGTAYG